MTVQPEIALAPQVRTGTPSGPAAILARDLEREFERGKVMAVRGISLEVRPGEIFGLLGPNGSGKTTTVRMLTTMLPPTGGRAEVAGYDIRDAAAEVRRSIGVALQEVALDPLLTARDHMRLQCALHSVSRSVRASRAEALLARVGLTAAADARVRTYSGGMKRRLDLALALVHQPAILFLDEPTVGLDPQSRAAIWEEVRRLARDEGVAVFMTTQYIEEADALADRVAIVDRGEVVAAGTPMELKGTLGGAALTITAARTELAAVRDVVRAFGEVTWESSAQLRCRLADKSQATAVVGALERSGLGVEAIEIHGATLEEVFLEKTGHLLERDGRSA